MSLETLKEISKWILASLLGLIIILICLLIAPYLYEEDPLGLHRQMVRMLAAGTLAIIIMAGGGLFIDWFTPGDWHIEVGNGNLACAIGLGALYIAIALCICWV